MSGKTFFRKRSATLALLIFGLSLGAARAQQETLLYNFCEKRGCPDGLGPYAGVVLDQKGNLYGTTKVGGSSSSYGGGTVFELSPGAGDEWAESVIYTFPNMSIGYPVAPVYMDAEGNLFGSGNSNGDQGSVYELTLAGGTWSESTLIAFLGGSRGGAPYGGLVPDAEGKLYGTTSEGGIGYGVIYKLVRGSGGQWTESVAHEFVGGAGDGAYCEDGLTAGKPGVFYGTTRDGGAAGDGTVFEFTP